MTAGVFLIQGDNELVELCAQPYDSEGLLQHLLARYPQVLAGEQIDSDAPRRWVLVSREQGVPVEEGGPNRWALDHLFLDQDGIPTLVEVKRSSDTRIRREVVGQLLDYAANAVAYWPVEMVQSAFEKTCRDNGGSSDEALLELLDPDTDSDAFWQQVKENLQAGKVRLVFVADAIPVELQRVVEFLNRQMDPATVLAIEVKQYVGQGLRALVPRVLGLTAEARLHKATGRAPGHQWNEGEFFTALEARRGPEEAAVARRIFAWTRDTLPRMTWGRGGKDGSYIPVVDHNGLAYWPIAMWTYGRVEIQFQFLLRKPPFDSETLRQEFLTRLNTIPGVRLSENAITKRPAIPLATLRNPEALDALLQALQWAVETIRAT